MDLSRQSQIVVGNPADYKLLIIGAGGIGSNAAYVATCTGFTNITVFEPDVVEEENIAPQFYSAGQVGESKAVALLDYIYDMTKIEIEIHEEKYHRQHVEADIVVVAVDDMPTRRRIFQQNRIQGWQWWLDGRMGGTTASLFAFEKDSPGQSRYENEFLAWPNNELPCGQKATAFLTKGWIPGAIGSVLASIVDGRLVPLWQMYEASNFRTEVIWD